MVWAENITFHLLRHDYFAGFAHKPVADARARAQILIAGRGGAADPRVPMDLGCLYNRAVEDPDGHVFELVWMKPGRHGRRRLNPPPSLSGARWG